MDMRQRNYGSALHRFQGSRLCLFQIRRDARERLDYLRFRLGVVVETLGCDLAQVPECRALKRWAVELLVMVAPGPPAHAHRPFADGSKPLERGVDEVPILVKINAALVGNGIEFLAILSPDGDVTGPFEIGQRRIDDAGARRVPAGGLAF